MKVSYGLAFCVLFSSFSNTIWSQDFNSLDYLGLQISGCNGDRQGELIFLYTTCGFVVDSLVVSLDTTFGNYTSKDDYYINKKGESCGWKPGDISVFEECENLIPAGSGDFIPAGSMIIVQMTSDMETISSLKGECDIGVPIYVIANDCIRVDEAFPSHNIRKDTFGIEIKLLPDQRLAHIYSIVYGDKGIFDLPLHLFSYGGYGEWSTLASCDTHHVINFQNIISSIYPEVERKQPSCQALGKIVIPTNAEMYSIDGGKTWSGDSIFSDLDSGQFEIAVLDPVLNCPIPWPEPVVIKPFKEPFHGATWLQTRRDSVCFGTVGEIYFEWIYESGESVEPERYEYSIDSGYSWQDSWLFNTIKEGIHHLALRDKTDTTCIFRSTYDTGDFPEPFGLQGITPDSVGFCHDGRVEIQATGKDLLYSLDGVSYHYDSMVVMVPGVPYTVHIKEDDNNLCRDSIEVILYQTVEFEPDVRVDGNSASVEFLIDSKGPYTYLWSTADTTSEVNNLPPGFNGVEITDAYGCTKTAAVFIEENTCVFSVTDSIVDATCETPTTSIYLKNADTINTYAYDWSIDSFDGLTFIEDVPHGTYSVQVSYGNCSKQIEYNTPIGGIEKVEIKTQASGCSGMGSIEIESVSGGRGPFNVDLSGESFDSMLLITGLLPSVYPLLITDAKGCVYLDTVEITSDASLPVSAPKIQVTDCENSIYSIDFSEIAGGAPPYVLLFEGNLISGLKVGDLTPGVYSYEILDSLNCHSEIQELDLFEIPEISIANRDTFIIEGDPIFLDAIADTTLLQDYGWTGEFQNVCSHCLDTLFPKASEGTYLFTYDLKLIDDNACERVLRFNVEYLKEDIYIPNAFTPNGDNINDTFTIFAPEHNILSLEIYDRWGGQLHEARDLDFLWDGKGDQKKVNPGVYMYRVQLEDQRGKTIFKTGSVTVLR